MEMKKKDKQFCFLVLVLSVMFSNIIYAQTDESKDLASWNTVEIKYKLNKKWSFELAEQLRLKENISVVDEYFTELQTQYSINKNFRLAGGFRFMRENDTQGNIQGYENHFRYNIDATYKHKINDLSLKYRLRYQNKNELGVSTSQGDYPKQNLRFKTSLEYNFRKWKLDPEISAEIFNRFGKDADNEFSKYRLTFGTEYKLKKIGTIGMFYRFEKELNEELPETTNIIGLKYTYRLKNK